MKNQDDNWLDFSDDNDFEQNQPKNTKDSSKLKNFGFIIIFSIFTIVIIGVIFKAVKDKNKELTNLAQQTNEKWEQYQSEGESANTTDESQITNTNDKDYTDEFEEIIDNRPQTIVAEESDDNDIKVTLTQEQIDARGRFLTGYEFAEFDNFEKYNSPASENGLEGAKVVIHTIIDKSNIGKITTDDVDAYYMLVTAKDEKKWLILTFYGESLLDTMVDKPYLIKGTYQGYSDEYDCPAFLMEDGIIDVESKDYIASNDESSEFVSADDEANAKTAEKDYEIISKYEYSFYGQWNCWLFLVKPNTQKGKQIRCKLTVTDKQGNIIDTTEDVCSVTTGDIGVISLNENIDGRFDNLDRTQLNYDFEWSIEDMWYEKDTTQYQIEKYNQSGTSIYVTVKNTGGMQDTTFAGIGALFLKDGKYVDNCDTYLTDFKEDTQTIELSFCPEESSYDEIIWYKK